MIKFKDVLDSSLEQLIEAGFKDQFEDETSKTYALMLRFHKKGELQALNLLKLTDRNLLVLRHLLNGLNLKKSRALYNSINLYDEKFQGEIYFYLGQIFKENSAIDVAMTCFQLAYKSYDGVGCKVKAIESLYLYTIIQASDSGTKNLIPEFEFLIQKASKAGASLTAAKCYYFISREYARHGANEVALSYASQALDHSAGDNGVEFFYHALLNRCTLLIKLGQKSAAQFDYQKARVSNLDSVKIKLKKVKVMFESSELNLTATESLLIEALSDGALTKQELVLKIYGEKIDWFAADSRFKMLLSRLRKKYPSIVNIKAGKYQVNENRVASAS